VVLLQMMDEVEPGLELGLQQVEHGCLRLARWRVTVDLRQTWRTSGSFQSRYVSVVRGEGGCCVDEV
jgi:hypothetical protein